jgi:hypothetical protein
MTLGFSRRLPGEDVAFPTPAAVSLITSIIGDRERRQQFVPTGLEKVP